VGFDYAYQDIGSDFLADRKNALLADEPGLGKSKQSIVAADKVGVTTITVVCPASMVRSWEREFLKWQTTPRKLSVITKGTNDPINDGANILSYNLATQNKLHAKLMKNRRELLILDECDFLKNPSAKRTQKCLGMGHNIGLAQRHDRVWALSGTPVRNHVGELWPLLNALYQEGITIE